MVTIWENGMTIREFLYVDDLAEASVYLMNTYENRKIVNIGTGVGVTSKELAESIKEVVAYTGEWAFDTTNPDGTPVKINDVRYSNSLSWKAKVDLFRWD